MWNLPAGLLYMHPLSGMVRGLVKGSILWCDWDCSSYRIPSFWSQFLVNCPCMTWLHRVALASKFYVVLEVILHYPYPCMTCVCRVALASDSTLLAVWTTAPTIRLWPWSRAQGATYIFCCHLTEKSIFVGKVKVTGSSQMQPADQGCLCSGEPEALPSHLLLLLNMSKAHR